MLTSVAWNIFWISFLVAISWCWSNNLGSPMCYVTRLFLPPFFCFYYALALPKEIEESKFYSVIEATEEESEIGGEASCRHILFAQKSREFRWRGKPTSFGNLSQVIRSGIFSLLGFRWFQAEMLRDRTHQMLWCECSDLCERKK